MDVLAVVKAVMDVTAGAGAAVVQGIPEVPDGAVGVAASDEAAYANIPLGAMWRLVLMVELPPEKLSIKQWLDLVQANSEALSNMDS